MQNTSVKPASEYLFLVFLTLLISVTLCGCESRATAVATTNDSEVMAENNRIHISKATKIEPDETQTRLWLCPSGRYLYDNEDCDCVAGDAKNSVCSSSVKEYANRKMIQGTIQERYPGFLITSIERTERPYHHWQTRDPLPVFYISLKKAE